VTAGSVPFRFHLGLEWVTEWVSRHVVVTCYRLLSDLPTTCKPRFASKNGV